MIDQISKVLTEYKADVSDHVAGLKKLKGEERKRAEETIAANEKVSASLENQIKTLGKVSMAIAGVVGGFMAARSALNSYAENAKLSAAAAGVSIDNLVSATKGLRTEQELLADAAKMNNGAIRLTSEQMAIAERAILQYTRRGHDSAKAHDAILQAVTALKIDGLKDLGVFVDMTGLKMEDQADRGKILQRILESLTGASNEFAKSQRTASEDIQASSVRIENAIDRLKNNVGKGVGYAAGVVEEMGQRVAKWWGGPQGEDTLSHHITYNVIPYLMRLQALSAALGSSDQYVRLQGLAQYRADLGMQNDPKVDMALHGAQYKTTRLESETKTTEPPKSSNAAAVAAMTAAQALARFANASVANENGFGIGDASALLGRANVGEGLGVGSAAGYGSVFGADTTGVLSGTINARQTQNWRAELANRAKQRTSMLESTIGPLSQFDAYKQAWEGLTSAVTAGYSAMVDGSMSFGKAFKQSIAEALKSTGAMMMIEALKETAAGFASLALGPIGGVSAAGHFKAAGLYAAGAVAAGVAARGLGGGGGGASAGGGATGGAPARAPSASEAAPQSSIVYVVGDPHDTETNPRRRQNNARRIVAEVTKNAAGGSY